MKEEGSVAGVDVDIGAPHPHLGCKLPSRQRQEDSRPSGLPVVDAGVDGRRLPGAGRPQGGEDL